jgi:hypothetical protein
MYKKALLRTHVRILSVWSPGVCTLIAIGRKGMVDGLQSLGGHV